MHSTSTLIYITGQGVAVEFTHLINQECKENSAPLFCLQLSIIVLVVRENV